MSHLSFVETEKKPKTSVYSVSSNHDGTLLGKVYWYSHWHQYIFEPTMNCVWSSDCLGELNDFISVKNNSQRKNRVSG
jgi:hypothetical protein